MVTAKTILRLVNDGSSVFDGSTRGIDVKDSSKVQLQGGAVSFATGGLEFAESPDIRELKSFTISASIALDRIGPQRQSILVSQDPAIELFVEPNGQVVGSIHTEGGQVDIRSGDKLLQPEKRYEIRLWRDDAGSLGLEIDGQVVGSQSNVAPPKKIGAKGMVLGAAMDGRSTFNGKMFDVQIKNGAVTAALLKEKQALADKIKADFSQRTGLTRVHVRLLADESAARLQHIKDIMNAAGVDRINDLDTFQVTKPLTMTPNMVLVGPRKGKAITDWKTVPDRFVLATPAKKQEMLAAMLPNRHSVKVLQRSATIVPETRPAEGRAVTREGTVATTRGSVLVGRTVRGAAVGRAGEAVVREPLDRIADAVTIRGEALEIRSPRILETLKEPLPFKWPISISIPPQTFVLQNLPVNSSVIIAGILDLTNIKLTVDPHVETLYIIAEKIVCGPNATITWSRPGGTTPARADDPNLNGRGWSGVQTKPDSRDGLDGGHGSPGGPGIAGRAGNNAPKLEIWVKNMDAIPTIDLNGEGGIEGGRGQRGGSGGSGGNGSGGKRIWVFDWVCVSDPGDGGNGGFGGPGGPGGPGGRGANGGKITIGVLEGTLESTVTSRSFKIKNQGGPRGRGGDGGPGGLGGRGGASGAGDTCHDAKNGVQGANGQPGAAGPDGSHDGADGDITFFEFTEEEWEEQLTRPWIMDIAPDEVFPGDKLTIKGSAFTTDDRVVLGNNVLTPTVNADESISVTVPMNAPGGLAAVFVRRSDGVVSNRINVGIKPQLDPIARALVQGAQGEVSGRAFSAGASVLVNGSSIPATESTATSLKFVMPGTGGVGSSGGTVEVQVRNPDGRVSNMRTVSLPGILEIPFTYGKHNLSFRNFTDGVPDWSTYEDTYGAAEVWHELLDPIFGHPVLTAAFYAFYHYFLKGEANGGLATGFCTSMSAMVADRLWQGLEDTVTLQKGQVHKALTAIHGRLLSREALLTFHDQGREEAARIERSAREIEATFLRGTDRHNAPLLFFIPSGEVWDSQYFDKLGRSHCVMPYRFVYPAGRPLPQLTPDGSSTTSDLDGVEMFVWDCNQPVTDASKVRFRRDGSKLLYDYLPDGTNPQFNFEQGVTLGMMTNGRYHLSDVDLPFSGPFGLTRFILDFILSPAELQVTNAEGKRTGTFGGKIVSEIPGSHPLYLVKGGYMLPAGEAYVRKFVGTAGGKYTFNTIMPEGMSIALENVDTVAGQEDALSIGADGTLLRFSPAVEKRVDLSVCRMVGDQARALTVTGVGGGPGSDIDIASSPDLSLVRVGNQGVDRSNIEVRAFMLDKTTGAKLNEKVSGLTIPKDSDMTIAVTDWKQMQPSISMVPFE